MNVIYSSDNNYARHVGVAITSLYECNQDISELDVYLIDDGISPDNREKLEAIAVSYGRTIRYIPFGPHKEKLSLNNKWELPLSTYARLFVAEMVPQSVERLLYLDCDTIVCGSLRELWEIDMQGKTIAAVEDVGSALFQSETDTGELYRYFCAGVLLIDMKKWRKISAQEAMMSYLDSKGGQVRHHDQTILNGVFWNDCILIHPRYNALTPTFIMPYGNLKAYFRLGDSYYSEQEIRQSVKDPAVIHFTSANIGRPWENNAHPRSKIYQRYWKASAWRDEPWGTFRCTQPKSQRRAYWIYQHVPAWVIHIIGFVKGW